MKCENCGQENREGAILCLRCGQPLVDLTKDSATKALGETDIEEIAPKWGSARYTQRIQLVVRVEEGVDKSLLVDTKDIDELIIGRIDPDTHQSPPIDLTPFGAQDKGVSRKHAALLRKDGSLHLVDKGGANGTFLNGQKLVVDQPRVLRDGDDIRLGFLTMRVAFERNHD